jgi:hypothetical protein
MEESGKRKEEGERRNEVGCDREVAAQNFC